jgi:hypothetical protein
MMDNPLKQYFRRPGAYFTLPSKGVGYPEESLIMTETGELPVYPMTAIDEITARTPDALFNGTAVVDIIQSCIPNIKNAWDIPNIDLDPILVAIRIASYGDEMEIDTQCPSCEELGKYDVNLPVLLSSFDTKDFSKPLVLDDIIVKFSPLAYKSMNDASIKQVQIQKQLQSVLAIEDGEERDTKSSLLIKEINELSTEIISKTIEYIKVPGATVLEQAYILEYLQNCDRKSHEAIKDYSISLREGSQIKPMKIQCPHCSHEYEQNLNINVTDFFG